VVLRDPCWTLGRADRDTCSPALPDHWTQWHSNVKVIPLKGYKVFWAYLLFLLAGYLTLGKGFAYVGIYPIYVAEIGLALGGISTVVVLLLNGLKMSYFRSLVVALLLTFGAWQALCTIPYLNVYGIDALRDGALWGYAAFAIFVVLLVPYKAVDNLFILYGRVLPYTLICLLIAFVYTKIAPLNIFFPGAPVPLLEQKPGDAAVYLAGAAAFMLLRLDLRHGKGWSNATLWLMWALWGANWVAWGVTSRASMLIGMLAVGVVLLLRPRTRFYRPVVLVTLLFSLLYVLNLSVPVPYEEAGNVEISARQMIANLGSTFGEESDDALEGTERWRVQVWESIIDYTFGGEYFWAGKGYGINLITDIGLEPNPPSEDDNRSPHNVFMTILARSGVPGLILWLLFLTSFGWMLVRKALARGRSTDSWDARYALWLLVFWLACLLNASFDVYLEGPMGGVLFWSLIGISLVYLRKETDSSEAR
jgi:hypothetical protein